MKFQPISILVFIFFHFVGSVASQNDCVQSSVKICYLPDDQYCFGVGGQCGYTLDGDNMDQYLARKLTNLANFGPNGIVSCPIELVALDGLINLQLMEKVEKDNNIIVPS